MTKRFTFTRESYVPNGATKVSDKASGAVAYVYATTTGQPAAMAFHGRASKPDWHQLFSSEAARDKAALEHFQRLRPS